MEDTVLLSKKNRTYKYFITYYSESFSELKGHVHTDVSIPQQTPAIKTCGVLPVSSKPLQVSASWKVAATGRVLRPKDTTHCCKKWFGVSLILGRIFRLISNKKNMPLSTQGCLLTQGETPVLLHTIQILLQKLVFSPCPLYFPLC